MSLPVRAGSLSADVCSARLTGELRLLVLYLKRFFQMGDFVLAASSPFRLHSSSNFLFLPCSNPCMDAPSFWMRVDGDGGHILRFDNMGDRPIKGTCDARRYEIVLDVPVESVGISFGVQLIGRGEVWLSDVRFEVVGMNVKTTGS